MAGFFDRVLGSAPSRRPLDHPTVDQVRDLVQEGQDVQAVKVVRERTGQSLVEAKALVDDIVAGRWVPVIPTPGHSLADRCRKLLARERAAEAVATVSRESGMSEDEASRFLEALER